MNPQEISLDNMFLSVKEMLIHANTDNVWMILDNLLISISAAGHFLVNVRNNQDVVWAGRFVCVLKWDVALKKLVLTADYLELLDKLVALLHQRRYVRPYWLHLGNIFMLFLFLFLFQE